MDATEMKYFSPYAHLVCIGIFLPISPSMTANNKMEIDGSVWFVIWKTVFKIKKALEEFRNQLNKKEQMGS